MFRKSDSFFSALVWTLYFALWLILIAFYFHLSNRSDSNPQARIEK